MANLSYNEITRSGKEYRSTLLVEKVFQTNGKSNHFVTDKGMFVSDYLIIGDERFNFKPRVTDKEIEDYSQKILDLREKPVSQRKVVIGGKYQGKIPNEELRITDLQKSVEFGGQPVGSARVNKGILFEKHIEERLDECLNGKVAEGTYAKQVEKIIERCAAAEKSPVVGVVPMGALNQSRPINASGGQLYIMPPQHQNHGKLLTDITLKHANGAMSFLSLKYSSTLTFMNAGIGRYLSADQIKKGKITDSIGKQILETFSIDETMFCEVFNQYGKGKKFPNVDANINANKLKKFLQTCIGSNYWMVHGMEGGKVYFWEMSKELNPRFATVSGKVNIQYGGKQGNGKRIDITFSNQYFDFKINIRNKQGGLYPSHIMCDYVSKEATGKELL